MALSKVFIHLVFQGSSEYEYHSVEDSHNSVVTEANQSSPTLPPGPSPTQENTTTSDKDQLSREQVGKVTTKHRVNSEGSTHTRMCTTQQSPHDQGATPGQKEAANCLTAASSSVGECDILNSWEVYKY